MMTMIRKVVLVLLVCGFVQTGYATAESEPMGAMNYNDLSAALSTMTVRNLNDRAVALEALWEDRRVVLVFLRHFG